MKLSAHLELIVVVEDIVLDLICSRLRILEEILVLPADGGEVCLQAPAEGIILLWLKVSNAGRRNGEAISARCW